MGLTEGHALKKLYTKPTCKSKSIAEIAAFVREDLLRQYEAQKSRPPMEEITRPILLIEGYAGGAYAIKAALHEGGMQCHLGTLADNSELPLTCQAAGAVQPDVLLLDLRRFKGGGRDVLNEISTEPHLRRTPLVTLVDSAADSEISKPSDLHGSWRLSGPVDPEQCVTALRSLLRLWKATLELPPHENQKDGRARTRDSGSRLGEEAGTGTGRRIDWESICKEINE